MDIQPLFSDVKKERLNEIQGEKGPFWICKIPGGPELMYGYFYADQDYQFKFFADIIIKSPEKVDIGVNYIDSKKFVNGKYSVHLPKESVPYLERNITKLFRERDFFLPGKPISPIDIPEEVRFGWGVGR